MHASAPVSWGRVQKPTVSPGDMDATGLRKANSTLITSCRRQQILSIYSVTHPVSPGHLDPRTHPNTGSAWLLACALKITVRDLGAGWLARLALVPSSGFNRETLPQ